MSYLGADSGQHVDEFLTSLQHYIRSDLVTSSNVIYRNRPCFIYIASFIFTFVAETKGAAVT